jgi:hypothetical protein
MTFKTRTEGFWRGLLRDLRGGVGDGTDEGDGDGTGTGQPNGPLDGGAGALTEAKIHELINKTVGARIKAFESKIAKTLEATTASIVQQVQDALKTNPPPGGDGKPDDTTHPQLAGMQKQLDALNQQLAASKAEAEAVKREQREVKLRAVLSEHLAKHEIEGVRAQHAVGYLVDAAKRVRWEGEEPVFNDGKDLVDLETGVAEWAKSDEAKLYLAPRGASGSGTPPAVRKKTQDANGAAPPSKAEIGTALMGILNQG